jgi:hypothetical protein
MARLRPGLPGSGAAARHWPPPSGTCGPATGWRWSVFTDVNANDDPLPTGGMPSGAEPDYKVRA